jgi:hypothetical protein
LHADPCLLTDRSSCRLDALQTGPCLLTDRSSWSLEALQTGPSGFYYALLPVLGLAF